MKPSHVGGTSFGDAWFADPAAGNGNISTLDSEYLRLRVQPSDPARTTWGLSHIDGIPSSGRVGGSGFAAAVRLLRGIDLALGDGWPVDLASTGDVTDLYVDWIRVYT